MRKILFFIFIVVMSINISAKEKAEAKYVDFSTDRSTWFFKKNISNNGNKIIFSDFFPPFDPTAKVDYFDPLIQYELENNYYLSNDKIMVDINDIVKIYAPYFKYSLDKNILTINFTKYDKNIIDNFGQRNTKLEYTKKNWSVNIDLKSGKANYTFKKYEAFIGGRNVKFIEPTKVIFSEDKEFTLSKKDIQQNGKKIYISISDLMKNFEIKTIDENNYIALQFENINYITVNNDRIPSVNNIWRGGKVEKTSSEYTWADYMNDIIDNKRISGWFWKSFYVPSGKHFKDADGKKISLEADRIIPMAIYVPKNYNKNDSKIAFILHGGTGNENASAYRMALRDINLDEYAEKYNYILAFPNGWTQNPMWMHRQELYSFEQCYNFVTKNYPVKNNNIFLMGNSLGGRGTMDVAMRKTELFKAIVVTAPAWGVDEHKKWEQKKYSVKDAKNIPALIGVGTKDTTFSFRLEVGNKKNPGWITKDIVPYMKNATYVTVEEGNHTYNWGSILDMIFKFLDKNATNNNLKSNVTEKIEFSNLNTKTIDNILMISLEELQKAFGDKLEIYKIFSYDKDINKAKNYYTLIYNNKSLNFEIGETKYRKNIERYKEDIGKRDKDIDDLENAPKFIKAPIELDGNIYLPFEQIISELK